MADQQEMQGLMADRSGFYRMLASLFFKEVTEQFIDRFAKMPMPEVKEGTLLCDGFKQIKSYLARRGPDPRTDLAVDYARVFLSAGTYEGEAANPYESIYTSEDGLIMQEARDDVRRIYLTQGVNVDESMNLPEDHLSFELEFIAIMSDRAAALFESGDGAALRENLSLQRDFLQDHLLNWLPVLQERVGACAEKAFYPALMKITLGYVQEDEALLGELVGALEV